MKKQMTIFMCCMATALAIWYGSTITNTDKIKTKVASEPEQYYIESPKEAAARARKQNEARIQKQNQPKQITMESKHDKLDAFTMAQDFIESRLKCPRTAKWPWISYKKVTVHLGNGRYQISSYLDAQNSFGALVRTHFICVVQHTGGSDWRLINLTM